MSDVKFVEGKWKADGWHIQDEKGNIVALVDGPISTEQDIANAAELARRWNLHQELVEALEQMLKRLSNSPINAAQGMMPLGACDFERWEALLTKSKPTEK